MAEARDPDFERLLKGTVKLRDYSESQLRALKEHVEHEKLDLDSIQDPVIRDMMKRWDTYFP